MLRMNELHEGDIYMHDGRKLYAKLLRVQGTDETGGAVTVEMAGEVASMGLALFMRKFNVIAVQELANDAYENQGQ